MKRSRKIWRRNAKRKTMTRDQIIQLVRAKAASCGIDPDWAQAQIQAESNFDPQAVSPAGAQGLAQFMPATWRQYGHGDPFDPSDAMDAYCRYMTYLLNRYNGDYVLATAAYNAGPGRVDQAGGVPNIAETRNYVARIQATYKQLAKADGPPKGLTIDKNSLILIGGLVLLAMAL